MPVNTSRLIMEALRVALEDYALRRRRQVPADLRTRKERKGFIKVGSIRRSVVEAIGLALVTAVLAVAAAMSATAAQNEPAVGVYPNVNELWALCGSSDVVVLSYDLKRASFVAQCGALRDVPISSVDRVMVDGLYANNANNTNNASIRLVAFGSRACANEKKPFVGTMFDSLDRTKPPYMAYFCWSSKQERHDVTAAALRNGQ